MKLLKRGLKKPISSKIKSVIIMVFFALLSALFVSAGDVIVKNGEIILDENATADYYFGDGSQLTGITDTNTNCSVDGSCSLITYDSESLACSRLSGNTSDLCTLTDTTYSCSDWASCTDDSLWDADKLDGQDGSYYLDDTDTNCSGSTCDVTNTGTLDGYEASQLLDNTDTNCSADGSCSLITYDSESLACSRLSGNTSDLCTLTDTDTDTNCSGGLCSDIVYTDGSNAMTGNLNLGGNNLTSTDSIIGNSDNVRIGNAGSDSHSLTADDDLFVSGKLEVDDRAYFDYGAYFPYFAQIDGSSTQLIFNNDVVMSATYGKQFITALKSDVERSFVIADYDHRTKDFDHSTQADPTVFIHSVTDPDNDNTEWLSLAFVNATDEGVIATGKGNLSLEPVGDVVISDPSSSATLYVDGGEDQHSTLDLHGGEAYFKFDEGNTETKLWVPGAYALKFGTNNLERMQIQADGDIAMDTNTLFVDESTNRVGIGTISPNSKLQVVGTVNATSFIGQPYGYAKINDAGDAGQTQLAFGEGSAETSTADDITWDGTNNYFTIGQTGVYEVTFTPLVACASSTVVHMNIMVDGTEKHYGRPYCHSSVDPYFHTVDWVGSISSGSKVNATIDSLSAVNSNLEVGSTFKIKRIG